MLNEIRKWDLVSERQCVVGEESEVIATPIEVLGLWDNLHMLVPPTGASRRCTVEKSVEFEAGYLQHSPSGSEVLGGERFVLSAVGVDS